MKKNFILLQAVFILLTGCSPKLNSSFQKIFPFFKSNKKTEEMACFKKFPKQVFQKIEFSDKEQLIFNSENLAHHSIFESSILFETPNEKGSSAFAVNNKMNNGKNKEWGVEKFSTYKLISKAYQLKEYAIENGFNTWIGFLIDMEVLSGRKRFFVYDFENMNILKSGLVAHGSGGKTLSVNKSFSNLPGSSLSSLGIYKIGPAYDGSFGLAYKLYGLQESNSNAYRRNVVLHSMGCVPDNEISEILCQSEGCPSVSPSFLGYLQEILDNSKKPVLLWIYN